LWQAALWQAALWQAVLWQAASASARVPWSRAQALAGLFPLAASPV